MDGIRAIITVITVSHRGNDHSGAAAACQAASGRVTERRLTRAASNDKLVSSVPLNTEQNKDIIGFTWDYSYVCVRAHVCLCLCV